MFGTAQTDTPEQVQTLVTIPRTTVTMWEHTSFRWGYIEIEEGVDRVNRGAALLDRENPPWVFGVIPKRLDMASAELCIIGQLYGSFDNLGIPFGMEVVDIDEADEEDHDKALARATSHGFLSDDDEVPYDVLDRVWTFMLIERHNRDGQPVFLRLP
jgi:hypothetical protein